MNASSTLASLLMHFLMSNQIGSKTGSTFSVPTTILTNKSTFDQLGVIAYFCPVSLKCKVVQIICLQHVVDDTMYSLDNPVCLWFFKRCRHVFNSKVTDQCLEIFIKLTPIVACATDWLRILRQPKLVHQLGYYLEAKVVIWNVSNFKPARSRIYHGQWSKAN